MSESRRVLAVVVLYRMSAEESPAFRSLQQALGEPSLAAEIDMMVFDNSPQHQTAPAGFQGLYLRNLANPGLAAAYNAALAHAGDRDWLLLLDQDTTVTWEYLAEVLLERARAAAKVCALVPKLLRGAAILSPHIPPFSPSGQVSQDLYGVSERALHTFNSGAVLRVQALREIGGFPVDFPLDSLDHATFHLLQVAGGEVFVLRSALQHSLAQESAAPAALRHRSILRGQSLYYRRFGTAVERRSFRRNLLRQALIALRAADFARAGRLLWTAARSGGSH